MGKKGMSGIITTVIIIGIALAAIGIVWFVINTVVSEQTAQVENSSSKVFQSCTNAGYYKMNTGDVCQGVVSYLGGEKCCQSGLVVNYGLISYWSFDVNASDDWGDNDGIVNGATWNSTGGFNGKGAYEFDGVNDYIKFSNGTFSYSTVQACFKTDSTAEQIIIGGLLGDSYNNIVLKSSRITSSTSGPDTEIQTTNTINVGQWYHLVAVKTGEDYPNNYKFYLNGEKNETEEGGAFRTSTEALIGARKYQENYDLSFNGTIDEVRIYNRALSADEVKALYELA